MRPWAERAAPVLLLLAAAARADPSLSASRFCVDDARQPSLRAPSCKRAINALLEEPRGPGDRLSRRQLNELDGYLAVVRDIVKNDEAKIASVEAGAYRTYNENVALRNALAPPGTAPWTPLPKRGGAADETKERERLGGLGSLGDEVEDSLPPDAAGGDLAGASQARLSERRPQDALRLAERAVAASPQDARAWSALAQARSALGQKAGAVQAARRALTLDPSDLPAQGIAGNPEDLSRGQSRVAGAKLDFSRPDAGVGTGLGTGRADEGTGRVEDAAPGATINVVFTLRPLSGPALASYEGALSRLKLGDRTGALLLATKAVEQSQRKSALPFVLRAQIAKALQNPKGAFADLSSALQLEPRNAHVLRERGLALLELDRAGEALADLDQAVALEPGSGAGWLYRAMALERLGRVEEALADYAKAEAADPALAPLAAEARARLAKKDAPAPAAASSGNTTALVWALAAALLLAALFLIVRRGKP